MSDCILVYDLHVCVIWVLLYILCIHMFSYWALPSSSDDISSLSISNKKKQVWQRYYLLKSKCKKHVVRSSFLGCVPQEWYDSSRLYKYMYTHFPRFSTIIIKTVIFYQFRNIIDHLFPKIATIMCGLFANSIDGLWKIFKVMKIWGRPIRAQKQTIAAHHPTNPVLGVVLQVDAMAH